MSKKCEYFHTDICGVEDAIEFNCTACHKKVWRVMLLHDLILTTTKDKQVNFGSAGSFVDVTTVAGPFANTRFYCVEIGNFSLPIDKKDIKIIGLIKDGYDKINIDLTNIRNEKEKLKKTKIKFIQKQ